MTSDTSVDSRQERLTQILLEYFESCEAGAVPECEKILLEHPDLRDDLEMFFSERERMEILGEYVRNRDHQTGMDLDNMGLPAIPDPISRQLGDFRLLREVGRGGMGTVYEAEQISLNRRVALKVLPFASALDPRQLQRFRNEAAAAAHLRHENIVAVYAVGCERGVHYFAMQYVDGQSLAEFLTERRLREQRRSQTATVTMAQFSTEPDPPQISYFDWVARVGIRAAMALEHAHQTGVVHRDVKPGNLLLDTQGHLWVTDFGLAQVATDVSLTITGELLGTLRYASPEQTRGRRGVVDHRSDIYSLGATLFELLTLRPPFNSIDRHELLQQVAMEPPPTLRSLVPEIPGNLETIVLKALRKDAADRYATSQELADDLQRFLDRRPVLAKPPRTAEMFWSFARRHPATLLASVIALLCVTAASLLIAALIGAERERTNAAQRRAQDSYVSAKVRADEAESRLRLARRAVNELMAVSEEELADRPEMLLLRKRVLRSALAFYQEFLDERRDDPEAKSELLETTERVQGILADLEILRSSFEIYLLRHPAVVAELGIVEEQRSELQAVIAQVGRDWEAGLKDLGASRPAERTKQLLAFGKKNEARLKALLTPFQQARLKQVRLQNEGASAFRDQEVATALRLSSEQREQMRVIEDETAFRWMRLGRRPTSSASSARDGITSQSADERIVKVLTADQLRKWRQLTGTPLKGLSFNSDLRLKDSSEPNRNND